MADKPKDAPSSGRVPVVPAAPKRKITMPGAGKQRRGGLLLLGVMLVAGAAFAFWYALQSVDMRGDYLVAARTINRWDIVSPTDFAVVEAHVGEGKALPRESMHAVLGKWATGKIPAGSFVTQGMFEQPPLARGADTQNVLIQVSLPASEAPFEKLESGDTVALLGAETGDSPDQVPRLGLIGVLTLDVVQGDKLFYVVEPQKALEIKFMVDRFKQANDRTILKMGTDLTAADIEAALSQDTPTLAGLALPENIDSVSEPPQPDPNAAGQ